MWVWAAVVIALYFAILGVAGNGRNPNFWVLDYTQWPVCLLLAVLLYRMLGYFLSEEKNPNETLHLTLAAAVLALPLVFLWFRSLAMTAYRWDSTQTVWRGKTYHLGANERFSLTYWLLNRLYQWFGG